MEYFVFKFTDKKSKASTQQLFLLVWLTPPPKGERGTMNDQTAVGGTSRPTGKEYAIRMRGRLIDLGASPELAYQIVGKAGPGLVDACLSLARTLAAWLSPEGEQPDQYSVTFAEMILRGTANFDVAIAGETWDEVFGWRPRVAKERFPSLLNGAILVLQSGIIYKPQMATSPYAITIPLRTYPITAADSAELVRALLEWLTPEDTGKPDVYAFRFAEMVLLGAMDMEPRLVSSTFDEVLEWESRLTDRTQLRILLEGSLAALRNKAELEAE